MIYVNFITAAAGEILGFSIHGHADYRDEGDDIVCAAVSSAAYMTANTVTDVLHADVLEASAEDNEMTLRIHRKEAANCRDLFAGFKLHMVALEEQYPENIRVHYLEV